MGDGRNNLKCFFPQPLHLWGYKRKIRYLVARINTQVQDKKEIETGVNSCFFMIKNKKTSCYNKINLKHY